MGVPDPRVEDRLRLDLNQREEQIADLIRQRDEAIGNAHAEADMCDRMQRQRDRFREALEDARPWVAAVAPHSAPLAKIDAALAGSVSDKDRS